MIRWCFDVGQHCRQLPSIRSTLDQDLTVGSRMHIIMAVKSVCLYQIVNTMILDMFGDRVHNQSYILFLVYIHFCDFIMMSLCIIICNVLL